MEDIVTYTSEGQGRLSVMVADESVWLTQAQIAELFGTQRPAITKHLKNIFVSGELNESSTSSILEHMGNDGLQHYQTKYYNLDVVISVGYRINSKRATQFRQWATVVLREHLLKGYTVRQPATIEHLQEMKQNLEYQIADLRKQIERLDVVTNTQYGELYKALIELTSQKQLQESKRRRIGFTD
jgi:hypothetical protein